MANATSFKKGHKVNLGKKNVLGMHWKIKDTSKMREWKIGRKRPREVCQKISDGKMGDKHWNWKGGITHEPYSCDWIDNLRESIRKRDNYICHECGIHQDELSDRFYKHLDIHHIDYNKENCNPNNLISLCRSCHVKTNINRLYWRNYYETYGTKNKTKSIH
jgi:hypothetical protein